MIFKKVIDGAGFLIGEAASAITDIPSNIVKREKKEILAIIKAESLTCTSSSCNCLATPLYTTRDKYKCIGCDRQFADTNHNIKNTVEAKYRGNDKESIYNSRVEYLTLLHRAKK